MLAQLRRLTKHKMNLANAAETEQPNICPRSSTLRANENIGTSDQSESEINKIRFKPNCYFVSHELQCPCSIECDTRCYLMI